MEGENKPIKKGNKYYLQNSPIENEQIQFIYSRTPQQHIHKRPAKGGGEWEYVTGTYVKKALNYLFGWLWDFEIMNQGNVEVGGKIIQVWVQGRLTIKQKTKSGIETVMVKTQYGGADVKYLKNNPKVPIDFANDLKAASTDALKKCASEIGIANDVYGKEEFREIEQATTTEKTQEAKQEVDFLSKLKELLAKHKRSNETEVEAYNRITGYNIKSLNIKQSTAQKYYYNLIDSPVCQS